ncbi:hypothetical protein PI124_g2727 [Phytophthora idaei]|nr:hypothetical protein PI125_g7037 [Phytophthora idaei]KAG3168024.1 hypothetical protein PI126_g3522 [Phytophthora idaei]KAG3252690.1 hypothetical protein PI124_g2727 [Phytophthora idaei]
MPFARFQYLLLLITVAVAGSSATLPSCNETDFGNIEYIVVSPPLDTDFSICNIRTAYPVYPFKPAPTGEFQKVCEQRFCQLGLQELFKNQYIPQCNINVNGAEITVRAHLQSICPDLSME